MVDLKEEMEGAVIEFCFNLFHILMAEGKKEYLYAFVRPCGTCNLS